MTTTSRLEGPSLRELHRGWRWIALRGALAVVFGLVALIWPGITALALAIIFGAFSLIDGAGLLADAVGNADRPHRGARIVAGALGVGVGIVALVWPGITVLALAILVGIWAILTGIAEMVAAVRYRRQIRGELLLGLAGLVSVLIGLLILAWPAIGVVTVAVVIGIYALISGVLLIALAMRLRRLSSDG